MMIDWLSKKNSANLNECLEEIFFRAMIIVGLIGCTTVVLFDLLLTRNLLYIVPANLVIIQILLLALYAVRNMKFHRAALMSMALLNVIVVTRGFMYPEFHHATCILLITIGFMAAMVSRGVLGKIVQWSILVSFLGSLFNEYWQIPTVVLIRQAVPYLVVYSIITILSGLLKDRYAKNQARLTDLIGILHKKNAKFSDQHSKLESSYQELSELNKNLATIIKQKTSRIAEKNKQLADIVYENSHCLRAPLARMLGLLHLIKMDPSRRDYYISKLDDQALEMDNRIRMISSSIERNLHE